MICGKQQIYFQKQGIFSNNCAVHTVNNLVGYPVFSSKTFDEICSMLQTEAKLNGFTTRTRHMMGGDYDINVIEKALQNLGLETIWVDSRVNYNYKYEKGTYLKGYILNFQSEENAIQKILSYSNRHWICVKLQSTDYYMLDSKKHEPLLIEDIDYFINRMREDSCQILEVRGRIHDNKKEFHMNNKPFLNNKLKNPSVLLESQEENQQITNQSQSQSFKQCQYYQGGYKNQNENFSLEKRNKTDSKLSPQLDQIKQQQLDRQTSKNQQVDVQNIKQTNQKMDEQKKEGTIEAKTQRAQDQYDPKQ